ncbi:hypothetical protein ASG03_12100 [Rhizobium sp. Leaf341]|nr:hypothetical protein ASG03_12100 [Rhizobium sp. Leaf341]
MIWDGHTIIPSEQGLYYLPLDFFVDLPIHTLIFLKTDPSVLARRAGLSDSCALKISELQMIELGYMKDLSNALKCQFKIIPSASQNLLEETLLEYGITTSRN